MAYTISAITKRTVDHSDRSRFSFSFFCDRCGKEWRSETLPFRQGCFTAVEHEEALSLLWNDEHKAAFERANVEAQFHFTFCPVCGRTVCDDCLYVSGGMVTDICRSCLTRQPGGEGDEQIQEGSGNGNG